MATVSGSFTAAGASAALQLTGLETVAISLSGTYSFTWTLQREMAPGSDAWEDVTRPRTVANETVSFNYRSKKLPVERIRLNVSAFTSGTGTYSLTDGDEEQTFDTIFDNENRPMMKFFESGVLTVGNTYQKGSFVGFKQGTPTAKTTSATLTAAELLSGIITVNQGAADVSTLTLPTGSAMETALLALVPQLDVDDAFEFSLINISTVAAEDAVLAAGSGFTIVGNVNVASNNAATDLAFGTFRVRRTAANTYVAYRVG